MPAAADQELNFSLAADLFCEEFMEKKIQANIVLNSPDLTKGKEVRVCFRVVGVLESERAY